MAGFDRLFITSLSISYMLAKGEIFTAAFALTQEVKAKAAPNSQNRKWLNFQDKIDRKSKVSKLNDVETVETVEDAEATRNGYYNRKVSRYSWTGISGVECVAANLSSYLWSKFSGPIHSGMPRSQGHLMGSSSPRNLRSGGT